MAISCVLPVILEPFYGPFERPRRVAVGGNFEVPPLVLGIRRKKRQTHRARECRTDRGLRQALNTQGERIAREQNILRVKGYAAVKGKPMRLLVQAVGSRVRAQYDRPWKAEETRMGRLVVIGEHDDISRDRIEAVLKG